MTLTRDRKTDLLSTARLFDGVDAEGMDRIAAVAVEVEFPAGHVIARQGEIGTGFFVIVSGAVRVVRDGADARPARAGRLLRGAVRARRAAAHRAGHRRRADDLPRDRDLGLRGRPARPSRASRWPSCAELAGRLRDLTEAARH